MKTKFIGTFLVCVLLLSIVAPCRANGDGIVYDIPPALGDEEEFWNLISELSPSDLITAGVMGFFYRESRLKPDSVAGWPERNFGLPYDICEHFTQKIDAGLKDGSTKEYFIKQVNIHLGGYGLGQWSEVGYLERFYDYMREHTDTIADIEAQCEFTLLSMQENERLWKELSECTTALQTGRRIGGLYDGASMEGIETIASFSDYYYRRFHEG